MRIWKRLLETLRLMVGVPDYRRYLNHRHQHHPDQPVLSEAEFFAERQRARYGSSSSRCC